MTKPRTNPDRLLFGLIGSFDDTSEQKSYWNRRFLQEGLDAFMDHYPTKEGELPERLSEMFHFDRRGYIVSKSLQKAIIPLLDSFVGKGSASVVVNRSGVLTGYNLDEKNDIYDIWMK